MKDVQNVGKGGDVKDVSDGYFRNFLLPRRLAKLATAGTIKEAETIQKRSAEHAIKKHDELVAMIAKLPDEHVVLERKASEEGKLFGSITEKDIVEALHKKGFTSIEEKHIVLEAPIKSVGEHMVKIHISQELEGVVKLTVEKSA